ncbi:hypothetical protein PENSPDRAFT_483317 [Peniophora sp. CONT]|nr:hypothetical protein PENSPDRAFT_483317 [Peniophora sp. CONT]
MLHSSWELSCLIWGVSFRNVRQTHTRTVEWRGGASGAIVFPTRRTPSPMLHLHAVIRGAYIITYAVQHIGTSGLPRNEVAWGDKRHYVERWTKILPQCSCRRCRLDLFKS